MVAVNVTEVVGVTDPTGLDAIEIEGVTEGVTVTCVLPDTAVHPFALVAVTLKVPVLATVMDEVVAPLLHR